MDRNQSPQASRPNTSSNCSSNDSQFASSSTYRYNRASESSFPPYAGAKDIVTADEAPPAYTRYDTEQPRQLHSQPQPQSREQGQYERSQPQRDNQNTAYLPAPQRQAQPSDHGYHMDQHQDYNGGYGSERHGILPRRGVMGGGGPLHRLLNERLSNQGYQSEQQMNAQPGYGYDDDMSNGLGRCRRRGLGRRRGGGPLHLLLNEAAKRF